MPDRPSAASSLEGERRMTQRRTRTVSRPLRWWARQPSVAAAAAAPIRTLRHRNARDRNSPEMFSDVGLLRLCACSFRKINARRTNELVIAKGSSQPPPLDQDRIDLAMTFVEAMLDHLT